MVESRSMNKCVIFVALTAYHAILLADGRQLKYKEREETAESGSKSINLQQNDAGLKEDFQSAKPSAEIFPPSSFDDSATVAEDGFRPTTPGNSPGVDHKLAKEEEVVKGDDSHDGGHSVTGYKDDYPKTASGPSRGIGHLLSNKKPKPKA